MISPPLSVRAIPSSKSVPLSDAGTLSSILSETEGEWVAIVTQQDHDEYAAPDAETAGRFDVVWRGTNPLLKFFWRQASPLLIACLGISQPILIRRSCLEPIMRDGLLAPEPLGNLGLLFALVEAGARFGTAPDADSLRNDPPECGPRSPIPHQESFASEGLRRKLLSLSASDLVPAAASRVEASAVQAGVLLIHDFLEASHSVAQSIEGQGRHHNGDYWHAIMHRREPDFGNSKYWFRRVGEHPVFTEAAQAAFALAEGDASPEVKRWNDRLTASGWDPFAFVDLCEQAHQPNPQFEAIRRYAERVQMIEMLWLLRYSWVEANDPTN
jgi:hypothetical protein